MKRIKLRKKNQINKSGNNYLFLILSLVFLFISLLIITYKVINPSNNLSSNSAKAAPPTIISGQPTQSGQWSFMVALYDKKGFWTSLSTTDGYLIHNLPNVFRCGGTLIGPHWVLTAAHCLYAGKRINTKPRNNMKIERILTPSEIGVAVGFYDIQKIIPKDYLNTRFLEIDSIYQPDDYAYGASHYKYPDFGSTNFLNSNDIALLKLKKDVYFPTISLTDNFSITLPKNSIYDIGWGITKTGFFASVSNVLNGVWLTINSLPIADSIALQKYYHLFMSAGSKSQGSGCSGDSGGPALAYNNNIWVQVGINSSSPDSSCSLTYFTNVTGYLSWIYKISGIKINQGTFQR